MRFKNPLFFLLFIPVSLLFIRIYFLSIKGKYFNNLNIPSLKLWDGKKSAAFFWKKSPRFYHLLGYLLGSVFLVFALARPQTSYQKIKKITEGIDIVITLDLSASMRVEDFQNYNRLEVAKEVIKGFILGRNSDRIGLVGFSGEPITFAPLTLDYDLVLTQLENASIGDLKDGTAIGEGLALSVSRLAPLKAKTKVVILVTDGDNTMGQIDPLTAGEMAKGFGIKVYSIAIGREGRVRMPFEAKDMFGRTHRTYQYYDSSINPELLRKISQSTGGKFYRVEGDLEVFRQVFKDIDQLEKTVVTTSEQVRYDEKFLLFLTLALSFIFGTWFLQNTVTRVYP